jgi:hypothetical protein
VEVVALTERGAEQKATAAGYDVGYVTRRYSWSAPLEATTVVEGEYTGTMSDGTTVNMIGITDPKTGKEVMFPKDKWSALPSEQQNIMTTKGYDALVAAAVSATAAQQVAQQHISDFASSKGVDPNDLVSLYYAGVGVDTLKAAYPGNDTYFDSLNTTLEDVRPYVTQQDLPGPFLTTEDTPTPIQYVPDLEAAVASGAVTVEALRDLNYDSVFLGALQARAEQLQVVVARYEAGMQPEGEGLTQYANTLTFAEEQNLIVAMRELGYDSPGTAITQWRRGDLTAYDKARIASVIAGYPAADSPVASLYRQLTTPSKSSMVNIVSGIVASPIQAIIAPFAKDITVGELQTRLEPYATVTASGTVESFDLKRYMTDHPYDASLLVRGGFKPEDVEQAQAGQPSTAMPQGATALDWAILGAVVASFALPAVRGGTMALFGPKGPLHAVVQGHVLRAEAATLLYASALVGETALKVGLPVGLTIADIANWSKWSAEERAVAGIFTALAYIPIAGPLFRLGRTGVQYARAATSRTPAVPGRALTTGYYDLYPVQTPKSFFDGLAPEMREEIHKIVTSKMSPDKKIEAVADLLEPTETAPAFRKLLSPNLRALTKYSVPTQYQGNAVQAFESVPGATHDMALRLWTYLQQNLDVVVSGSVAMNANGIVGITPKDFDFTVFGDEARVGQVRTELGRVIGQAIKQDVKRAGSYPPPAYDLTKNAAPPVTVDGVKFISIGELIGNLMGTVTSPGVESWGRGAMGPGMGPLPRADFPEIRMGTHEGRIADYHKLMVMIAHVVEQLKSRGQTLTASTAAADLEVYMDWLSKVSTEGPKVLPEGEAEQLRTDILELLKETQHQLLEQGRDVVVLDPKRGIVAAAVASPANIHIPGAIYNVSPDITPDIEMANTTGRFRPTQDVVFFSPKSALTYARTKTPGAVNPGLNILLTDPAVDIGPNGIIQGPSRYEYVEDAFYGNVPVIYDELTTTYTEFLPTPKTELSYELGIETGVMRVFDPVSGKTLTALVWRTPAAAAKGRVAPTQAETLIMTRMAFKSALRSVFKPHIRGITTTEIPESQRAGLFWFGDRPYDLRYATTGDLANAMSAKVRETLDQAIENLRARNVVPTEREVLTEVQRLLDADVAETQTVQVPVTITRGMRARLFELGHSTAAIDKMTPQQAWDTLGKEGKFETPEVEEVENLRRGVLEVLGGLDPQSRSKVTSGATEAYSEALEALMKDWNSGKISLADADKRLYYLNVGMLSLRLAQAALSMTLFTGASLSSTLLLPSTSLGTPTGLTGIGSLGSILSVPTSSATLETAMSIPSVSSVAGLTSPTGFKTTPGGITTVRTGVTTTLPPTPIPPPPPTPSTVPEHRKKPDDVATQLREAYETGEAILIWRQGELSLKDVWKAVVNPEKQTNLLTAVGTEKLPVTPEHYAKGPGSAQATLQWIGTGPRHAGSADLGIVDVFWDAEGTNLRFEGKGLETNVGERIASTTVGISIPQLGDTQSLPLEAPGRLKFGTTFKDAINYPTNDPAMQEFINKRIQEMLPDMSSQEIAQQLKDAKLPEARVAEILTYVPDKQRKVVAALLEPQYYVKVGEGFKFATTSARSEETKPGLEQLNGAAMDGEEVPDKELYTEDELKQIRLEALNKIATVRPKDSEKDMADFLLEVKL